MCGVAGIAHWGQLQDAETRIKKMADSMVHRGPDDEGFYFSQDLAFGFRRLSIVDLKDGRQPMVTEDGSCAVVFNGEIYNHQSLRKELKAKGYRFRTSHSDTESILLGWLEWGVGLFEKLNGMFAIGIWDGRNRNLVLARDRLGIKPLYFAKAGLDKRQMVFGSEVRAIYASDLLAKEPDTNGVYEYLTFQNNWSGRTPFVGVQQVEPGSYLVVSESAMRNNQFWRFKSEPDVALKFDDAVQVQREKLVQAVESQMQADVSISTFLSGGIDSGTVTALAASKSHQTLNAYTCLFDLTGVGVDRLSDEREYSRLMAQHARVRLHAIELPATTLQSTLGRVIEALEYPRMGMSYANYLVSELVARDSKVVLSGMGGDELFAGYVGRYQITPRRRYLGIEYALGSLVSKVPRYGERLARSVMADPLRGYKITLKAGIPPHEKSNAFNPEFVRLAEFDEDQIIADQIAAVDSRDTWEIVRQVDLKTYLAGLLTLEDKLSMAHSLETRVPLLDNELVDFSAKLPWPYLTDGDVGKIILRHAARSLMPEAVYSKPKMGFGPPDASWYRNQLRDWISERLAGERVLKVGIFNPDYIRCKLDRHFSGVENNVGTIWTALSVHEWAEQNSFSWG